MAGTPMWGRGASRWLGGSCAKAALVLLLVLLIAAVAAPPAQAKGVLDTFGTAGTLGGEFPAASPNTNGMPGAAVNTTGAAAANPGDTYVADRGQHRIQRFDAAGNFVSAWGMDVVALGPGNTGGFEVCVAANGDVCQAGTASGLGGGLNLPRGIAVDQQSGVVYVMESENRRASAFSADGDFLRAWGQDVVASGPGNTGGAEICVDGADVCKQGVNGNGAGAFSNAGSEALSSLAVAPQGAPNDGNVLVADAPNRRVQEFTPSGNFVRTFGWNVIASGPGDTGTEFEVCTGGADTCQAGSAGTGSGRFGTNSPNAIAEDSSGNIYTVEVQSNLRVQRFTLPGNVVTPQGVYNPEGALSGSKPFNAPNGEADLPIAAAVDTSTTPGTPGHLYVLKYFPKGGGSPAAAAREARVVEVDPAGNGGAGAAVAVHAAGAGIGSTNTRATGLALNSSTGRLYVTAPPVPVYVIDEVPPVVVADVEAAAVGATTATLKGKVIPSPLPKLPTLYRFEYARTGTAGNCGEAAAGWRAAPLIEGNAGNGLAPVPVEAQISNLAFEASYEFCLVARTEFNGSVATSATGTFETVPTAPVVQTGGASWSSPVATNPSLLLGGTVNPGFARTTYFFEYVSEAGFEASGFASATRVPVHPAEAGEGSEEVAVRQSISGLDPNTTYRYRLQATNQVGTVIGQNRAVAPPQDEDYFYELVSAGDSWGSGVNGQLGRVAASGERASFIAQAFGNPSSLPGPVASFISERGPGGWQVHSVLPEAELASDASLGTTNFLIGADLGSALWPESSFGERERGEARFGTVALDGTRAIASEPLLPLAQSGKFGLYDLRGASADLSSFAFTARFEPGSGGVRFFADEQLLGNNESNLYAVDGSAGSPGVLRLVNRADGPAGAVIGGRCGAGLGGFLGNEVSNASHAISADGETLHFTARPGEPVGGGCSKTQPKRIFKRVGGTTTTEVSAARCTPTPACPGSPAGDDIYLGASVDGEVGIFTTKRRLTNSDGDSTEDLYLYDSTPPTGQPELVQVSAGEVAPGHPVPGTGAQVSGAIDIAADGSRTYFVAKGVLSGPNGEGKAPVAGEPNLYLFERDEDEAAGRIAFVGKLDPAVRKEPGGSLDVGDEMMWKPTGSGFGRKAAHALPLSGEADGRYLLFVSFQKLVAADTDDQRDVYRFEDTGGGQMLCLSCSGEAGSGNGEFEAEITTKPTENSAPDAAAQGSPASGDASAVVFVTAEKLSAGDENEGLDESCTASSLQGRGCDVYLWREGAGVELISGGTEGFGVPRGGSQSGISADGENVFFLTEAPLVASDSNNANDLYVARTGGGFPAAATKTLCASNTECQQPSGPPPPPAIPVSPGFNGPGNVTKSKPKPCKKGKVRRGGKCVKKNKSHKHGRKGKKGKAKQQRAHNERGARR